MNPLPPVNLLQPVGFNNNNNQTSSQNNTFQQTTPQSNTIPQQNNANPKQKTSDLRASLLDKLRKQKEINYPEIFQNDLNKLDNRPWEQSSRMNEKLLTDYFNFGFNELTFQYLQKKVKYIKCKEQGKTAANNYNNSSEKLEVLNDGIPLDIGGFGKSLNESEKIPDTQNDQYLFNLMEKSLSALQSWQEFGKAPFDDYYYQYQLMDIEQNFSRLINTFAFLQKQDSDQQYQFENQELIDYITHKNEEYTKNPSKNIYRTDTTNLGRFSQAKSIQNNNNANNNIRSVSSLQNLDKQNPPTINPGGNTQPQPISNTNNNNNNPNFLKSNNPINPSMPNFLNSSAPPPVGVNFLNPYQVNMFPSFGNMMPQQNLLTNNFMPQQQFNNNATAQQANEKKNSIANRIKKKHTESTSPSQSAAKKDNLNDRKLSSDNNFLATNSQNNSINFSEASKKIKNAIENNEKMEIEDSKTQTSLKKQSKSKSRARSSFQQSRSRSRTKSVKKSKKKEKKDKKHKKDKKKKRSRSRSRSNNNRSVSQKRENKEKKKKEKKDKKAKRSRSRERRNSSQIKQSSRENEKEKEENFQTENQEKNSGEKKNYSYLFKSKEKIQEERSMREKNIKEENLREKQREIIKSQLTKQQTQNPEKYEKSEKNSEKSDKPSEKEKDKENEKSTISTENTTNNNTNSNIISQQQSQSQSQQQLQDQQQNGSNSSIENKNLSNLDNQLKKRNSGVGEKSNLKLMQDKSFRLINNVMLENKAKDQKSFAKKNYQ